MFVLSDLPRVAWHGKEEGKRGNILHRNSVEKKKLSKLWDRSYTYTRSYIPPLSLSLSHNLKKNERKEKKDSYDHGLFIYDIFDMLKVYIYV